MCEPEGCNLEFPKKVPFAFEILLPGDPSVKGRRIPALMAAAVLICKVCSVACVAFQQPFTAQQKSAGPPPQLRCSQHACAASLHLGAGRPPKSFTLGLLIQGNRNNQEQSHLSVPWQIFHLNTMMSTDSTGDTGGNLKQKRCHRNRRGNFVPVRMLEPETDCPERLWSLLPWGLFQTHLGVFLCDLPWVILLWQRAWAA